MSVAPSRINLELGPTRSMARCESITRMISTTAQYDDQLPAAPLLWPVGERTCRADLVGMVRCGCHPRYRGLRRSELLDLSVATAGSVYLCVEQGEHYCIVGRAAEYGNTRDGHPPNGTFNVNSTSPIPDFVFATVMSGTSSTSRMPGCSGHSADLSRRGGKASPWVGRNGVGCRHGVR